MNENSAISSWNLRLGRGTGEERFQFVLKFNQKLGSAYALSGASFRWGRETIHLSEFCFQSESHCSRKAMRSFGEFGFQEKESANLKSGNLLSRIAKKLS